VYTTEEKGTHRKSDGDKFHSGCDCKAMPGVNGITKIEGYNPDELLKRYYDCLATINDGHTTLTAGPLYEDFKRDVPEEKRKEPNAFNDYCEKRIVQEMETRDRGWLYDGRKLTVEYADDAARAKKETDKKFADERKTAGRLARFGVTSILVDDEERFFDEKLRLWQVRSYADLANGFELKTLKKACTFNTIDGYLGDASNKKTNCKAIVFDNSSGIMDDAKLKEYIVKSRRFKQGRVYIITSKGEYRFVR